MIRLSELINWVITWLINELLLTDTSKSIQLKSWAYLEASELQYYSAILPRISSGNAERGLARASSRRAKFLYRMRKFQSESETKFNMHSHFSDGRFLRPRSETRHRFILRYIIHTQLHTGQLIIVQSSRTQSIQVVIVQAFFHILVVVKRELVHLIYCTDLVYRWYTERRVRHLPFAKIRCGTT